MTDDYSGDNNNAAVAEEQGRAFGGEAVTPLQVFDVSGLHSAIVSVSRKLFAGSNYAEAIFAAFKRVEIEVKEVSGLKEKYSTGLMKCAFKGQEPKIKLTRMDTPSERNDQAGFKLIFTGAMGIRNEKAHAFINQRDPYKTLHYLALASLLLKRLDERIEQQGAS